MFYIYRHIRPDTNEVFYIGKGREGTRRHLSKQSRSPYWHNIIKLNGGKYDIEIIMSGLTNEEALEEEINLIQFYGRRRDGGTLCNLSLGGEGITGHVHTEETKKKMSEAKSGKINTDEHRKNISLGKKGLPVNNGTPRKDVQEKAWESSRKKIICTETGKIFGSVKEAAIHFNINYSTLKDYLRGHRTNKTTLIYLPDNQSLKH